MDVNPLKPVPVIPPPRNVPHERPDRERKKPGSRPKDANRDDEDDDSKRIDTYA